MSVYSKTLQSLASVPLKATIYLSCFKPETKINLSSELAEVMIFRTFKILVKF